MKNLFFLCLLITPFITYAQNLMASDFKKLYWLVGEWNRTNVKDDASGLEKWITNSEKELQGWGITMKGRDTVLIEKTKLIAKDDAIYYVADVPGNKELVYFKLTQVTDHSFSCENLQHDFPKKIVYINEGSILKATISGNGKSINYLFERKL
jgi:hypothetical protein